VLFWAVSTQKKLGKNSRRILERSDAVYYSSISIFELEMKRQLGKLQLPQDYFADVEQTQIRELPFESNHAQQTGRFGGLVKHDPFDRMILSQAAAEGFTLITADEKLIALNLPWIMDART